MQLSSQTFSRSKTFDYHSHCLTRYMAFVPFHDLSKATWTFFPRPALIAAAPKTNLTVSFVTHSRRLMPIHHPEYAQHRKNTKSDHQNFWKIRRNAQSKYNTFDNNQNVIKMTTNNFENISFFSQQLLNLNELQQLKIPGIF